MNNIPIIHLASKYRELIDNKQAPCYWKVEDDGAPYKCQTCEEHGPAKEMVFILCPNGLHGMSHIQCLDKDWLTRAKKITDPYKGI